MRDANRVGGGAIAAIVIAAGYAIWLAVRVLAGTPTGLAPAAPPLAAGAALLCLALTLPATIVAHRRRAHSRAAIEQQPVPARSHPAHPQVAGAIAAPGAAPVAAPVVRPAAT